MIKSIIGRIFSARIFSWSEIEFRFFRFLFVMDMDGRLDFYEQITQLISAGIQLETALRTIVVSQTRQDRVPADQVILPKVGFSLKERRLKNVSVISMVASDLIEHLKKGGTMSDRLSRWVGAAEASVILAGERSGNLPSAFERVGKSLDRQKQILTAILSEMAKPFVLMAGILAMFFFSAFVLTPQLLDMADISKWSGQTLQLIIISMWFGKWWWALLGLMIVAAILFAWSLSNWTGAGRRNYAKSSRFLAINPGYTLPKSFRSTLDGYAPYSIFRIYQASVFMESLIQMKCSGVATDNILRDIRIHSCRWLRSRIDDALWAVSHGHPLGVALSMAGQDFPDHETISFLMTLEKFRVSDEVLERFSERRVIGNIKKVRSIAKILNAVFLLIGALAMTFFYAGLYGVVNMSS